MMEKTDLKKILEEHTLWLNGEGGNQADLRRADLRGVDLRGADLRGADLRGANLDFSVLPLWCGSLRAKVDGRSGNGSKKRLPALQKVPRS